MSAAPHIPQLVRTAIRHALDTMPRPDVAQRFGVSRSVVSRIAKEAGISGPRGWERNAEKPMPAVRTEAVETMPARRCAAGHMNPAGPETAACGRCGGAW